MEKQHIISGFGGQGVVFAGKLLAESAMRNTLLSTYFPSYGIAMRGGAAKCDVIVADEEIGSPVVDQADIIISMSIEAMRKYEPFLKKNGIFVINSSLVNEEPGRTDIQIIHIPATEMANEIGNKMVATLVCLGYVAGITGVVPLEAFYESLELKKKKFGEELLALNKNALKNGWDLK
ncbi:2-oxoacid:acceptor oxidoreductase family protein [Planctomycetota bacterium]